MRTLTANALTEIAKKFGTEPVTIVEIEWDTNAAFQYATKDISPDIPGKILDIGELRTVLRFDQSTAGSVEVTLDDTDGFIKAYLEIHDVHKRPCTIYQHYGDLSTSDKFSMFKGEISTPFSWGENDRAIKFHVTSEIESYEVGFSPEESQLDFVSDEFVGEPWPLVFGHTLHVPAKKVRQTPRAELLEPLYRKDRVLEEHKIEETAVAYQQDKGIFIYWSLMRQAIRQAGPPVWWVLREYVRVILMEDRIVAMILGQQRLLQFFTRLAQQFPNQIIWRILIKAIQQAIQVLAQASNRIQIRKKWVEDLIEYMKHLFELDKKAVQEMLNARRNMGEKQDRHEAQEQEICDQAERQRAVVKVKGAENFPNLEDTVVIINDAKFLVQFDHDLELMLVRAGPITTFINDCNTSWTEGGCPQSTITDNLNVFYLDPNKPVPHLCGQLLSITDADGNPHIIRVTGQQDNKVTFEPPQRDANEGVGAQAGGQGGSLDTIINQIVEPPGGWVQAGPFGANIPAGFFTGQLNPNVWLDERTQFLLAILANLIPWGVNKDELRNLACLVFNLKFDTLQPVIIGEPDGRATNQVVGEDIRCVNEASGQAQNPWIDNGVPASEVPDNNEFRAEVGAEIRSSTDTCEVYIANILPSTIKGVYAYRTNQEGIRILQEVPTTYYIKNESADLTEYTVTALSFPCPIQQIPGQNWEDTVYVTMDSSVGPNVIDILTWLLETYTDKTVNVSNAATVKALLQDSGEELYPTNFAILDRPNVISETNRIAWESRIAIFLKGGEFFFRYLSIADSTGAPTLTETDIDDSTFTVHYSATESLVTRSINLWNENYLPLEDPKDQEKIVLRHNVKKYGMHEETTSYKTFNIEELVKKSATFWLIRNCNTWKRVEFWTFATNLRIEVHDFVYLDLNNPHVASSYPLLCLVEEATYDPKTNKMHLVLHTGIRAGETTQYPYYWPGDKTPVDWPTQEEIDDGYAGGYGPGALVAGTIDDCDVASCITSSLESLGVVQDGDEITLSWDAITSEDELIIHYVIQRNFDSGGWVDLATITDLEYVDSSLSVGTYKYRVKVTSNICRDSAWTETSEFEVV